MKELFKGKPLQVVEKLKKEIIQETKDIKLNNAYFECNGVEEIQRDIDDYLLSKECEKCVVFSDFDPLSEVIGLSQKAKVYWFCFENYFRADFC